jgi:signal transduction histidine kinase
MWWQIGAAANAVIALAYLCIAYAILKPLADTRQLRANKLGFATGLIFFTCAVHHGTHTVHLLGPAFGYDEPAGNALRESFQFHNAAWDVFGAAVGLYYWSLRATYGSLMRGAALFEDMKERQRRALEINDDIVQGLTVAKLALELDDRDRSVAAMSNALAAASRIISDLLGEAGNENRLGPGDLRRETPAAP